jgi:hypothetical protein
LAAPADLAAVVLDVPGGDLARAVEALHRSAPGIGVVAVRQGGEPSEEALAVFPLGTCYARNRGAAATEARALSFLDSDIMVPADFATSVLAALEQAPAASVVEGTLAFRRDEFEAAGGFDHSLGLGTSRRGPHDAELAARLGVRARSFDRFGPDGAVAAGRTARRLRDAQVAAKAALRGGVAGLLGKRPWAPPDPPPELPEELRELPPLTPLTASNPAKTHFIYAAGADLVVHLYVNPSRRLERSLAEREAIHTRAHGGVPALRGTEHGRDCLWVVEDRARGVVPATERAHEWFPLAAEWLVGLSDPERTPLDQSGPWREHAAELGDRSPEIERAVQVVGRLPAVAMHGDLQRGNVLIDGSTVGAVDWEGAWLEGIPGLDLVFLALFAESSDPDFAVLEALAVGGEGPYGALRPTLARLGVDDEALPAALLVMLATWALSEDRRRARLGSPPPRPAFRTVFDRLGPVLAERIA